MAHKKYNRDKLMVEIADFLFANPSAKRGDILAKFGEVWQISPRGIDRLLSEAKRHNQARLKEVEAAKREEMVAAAKGQAKKGIADREEILTALTSILRGHALKRPVKVDGDGNVIEYALSYPGRHDVIAAGSQIAQLEGYFAPAKSKHEVTGEGGAPLSAVAQHVVVFKDFSSGKNGAS
ncbi:MAG: hypothetical protein LBJ57_06350 [Prevotellaceae bacterium]|jgi:hypothetical protein|nr:hypothetical protein [Prevotellaceae bacterium]